MDRDRLKEVQHADLSEGKVNEDFVDWLKKSGPNYLLVVMIGICGYLGYVRWNQGKVSRASEAWKALSQAQLPGALEDVATDDRFAKVGEVTTVARLLAADQRLRAVQANLVVGAQLVPPAQQNSFQPPTVRPEDRLAPELRETELATAARLYQEVVDATQADENLVLYTVNGLSGLAAVAECRGDLPTAKAKYEAAIAAAGDRYPGLAEQITARIASLDDKAGEIALPSQAEVATLVTAQNDRSDVTTTILQTSLRDLIMPAPEEDVPGP